MEELMYTRILKVLFICAVFLFFVCSFASAVLSPAEINWAEQRYAEKIPQFTSIGYFDSSFQNGMDKALGDQISFSYHFKLLYNRLVSRADSFFVPLRNMVCERNLRYKDFLIFNGQLVLPTLSLEDKIEELDSSARWMNDEISSMDQIDVFLYYVTADSDFDFESGSNTGIYQYVCDNFNIPRDRCTSLEIGGFDDFKELYYLSDHHWNHVGSYRAYCQLLELLGAEEDPLMPVEQVQLPGVYNGSKSVSTGCTYCYDRMSAYRFDFPPLAFHIGGVELPDYGDLNTVMNSSQETVSYGEVYGEDFGGLIISSGNEHGERLLVVGDSFDNAVLKLLSCHFAELHSVDPRYFPVQTGKLFDLSDYVEENDIDKVLFIGNNVFFCRLNETEG